MLRLQTIVLLVAAFALGCGGGLWTYTTATRNEQMFADRIKQIVRQDYGMETLKTAILDVVQQSVILFLSAHKFPNFSVQRGGPNKTRRLWSIVSASRLFNFWKKKENRKKRKLQIFDDFKFKRNFIENLKFYRMMYNRLKFEL